MEIQRIRTETKSGHRPRLRNRARVVLEVDVIPQNGKIIFGRLCKQGVSRVEVYEDEVDAVLARLRTKQADEALELAKRICHGHREEWANENPVRRRKLAKMSAEERAAYIDQHANIRPEMYVSLASGGHFKRGLGALASVRVVARDEERTLSVPEFRELSEKEREDEWLIDPPHTEQNATERAASVQAKVFAQVLAELQKQNAQAPAKGGRAAK